MSSPLQTLTLAEIILAGRKAFEEGRLTAQNPNPDMRRCRYELDGHFCVVGAAMSPKVRVVASSEQQKLGGSISILVRQGIVDIPPADLQAVGQLQTLHDNWASLSGDWGDEINDYDIISARSKFLSALYCLD